MRLLIARSDRALARPIRPAMCLVILAIGIETSACAHATTRRADDQSSVESFVRRVRALTAEAKLPATSGVSTVEAWDPRLSSALLKLAISPTADFHRRVALEYRRLGILDQAYAHLDEAIHLDPQDAAAFDGRARIWRDWGFPNQGLADANRAVRLAPESAAAANTLGTLWQALGNGGEARRWYERALMLDPTAAFAMNNLCYASITARLGTAVGTCRRAVEMAPDSADARNNLALAHAAAGNFTLARKAMEVATDAAAVQYNVGMFYMADRQYAKAIAAFDEAAKLKPHFDRAEARAKQARALVESKSNAVIDESSSGFN